MKKIFFIFMLTGMVTAPVLAADVMNDITYVLNKISTSVPQLMTNAEKARITSLIKNLKAGGLTAKDGKLNREFFRLAIADLATIRPLLKELIEFNTKRKGLITDITDKFGARDAAIIMNNIYEIVNGLILIFEKVAGVEDPEWKALKALEAKQDLLDSERATAEQKAAAKLVEEKLAADLLLKVGLGDSPDDQKAGSAKEQKAEIEDLKKKIELDTQDQEALKLLAKAEAIKA